MDQRQHVDEKWPGEDDRSTADRAYLAHPWSQPSIPGSIVDPVVAGPLPDVITIAPPPEPPPDFAVVDDFAFSIVA
jgi:hypothetical protein